MKANSVYIRVLGLIGGQLDRAPQLGKRFVGLSLAHQGKPKRVMHARIAWRSGGRFSQHGKHLVLASQCAIEVRKVNRRRRKLRVEAQRRLVFGFGLGRSAPLRQKIRKRYTCLGPFGIEPLRGDEIRGRSLEAAPVGIGLAGGWNRRKQRYRPNANSLDRIREQRRNARPELIGWNAAQHLKCRHPDHRLAVREPVLRQIEIRSRKILAELDERARANDGGYIAVRGDFAEKFSGVRLLRPRGMKSCCVSLESLPLRPEPALNRARRPLSRFVAMAIVASVWRTELHRQIGTGNPKAVIMPPVHHHVGAFRHVTGGTRDGNIHILMVTMRPSFIFAWHMTLAADAISWRAKRGTMWVVAIAAGHPQRKHLALPERQVVVDLFNVAHLPVGISQVSIHRRDQVSLRKQLPGHPFFRELRTSGMAEAACFNLLPHAQRHSIALRHSGFCVRSPRGTAALVEAHREPFGRVYRLPEGPPAFLLLSPCDVTRSRAMTCLTANADFCPRRCEAVGSGVVVLAHAG